MSAKTPPFLAGVPEQIGTAKAGTTTEGTHGQRSQKKTTGHKKHTMIKRSKQAGSDAISDTFVGNGGGGSSSSGKGHSSHSGSGKSGGQKRSQQHQQGRRSAKKDHEGGTEFTVEASFIEEDGMYDEGWNVELESEHPQHPTLSTIYRYSQDAAEELHAQCESDADDIVAEIASELGLSEDQVLAARMFGGDLKRVKREDEFESEYTTPRRADGLPASKEKELSLLDEKIRDLKRQIKLAENGTHPELVAAFEKSEEECRDKEDVADILLQIQMDAFAALAEQERKNAEAEAEAEKNAEREDFEASIAERRHKQANERNGGDPSRVLRNRRDKSGGQTQSSSKASNKRRFAGIIPDYPLKGCDIMNDLEKIAKELSLVK